MTGLLKRLPHNPLFPSLNNLAEAEREGQGPLTAVRLSAAVKHLPIV